MLTEIALTPQVFDEDVNRHTPEWTTQLRELGRSMFPRNTACPTIVSDLVDGSWIHETARSVQAIQNHSARMLAQGVLTRIRDVLVKRPLCGKWPSDESSWATEALASHQQLRIDHMITSDAYRQTNGPCSDLTCLSETHNETYWARLSAVYNPTMELNGQIALLRPFFVHSSFLAFASPHIYGPRSGDFDFVAAAIGSALSRPREFAPVSLIDIHTEGSTNVDERSTRADNIEKALSRACGVRLPRIRLFFWRELLERVLLAGEVVASKGQRLPKVRWVVSFTHVVRPALDGPNASRPTWALLPNNTISYWRQQLYGTSTADPDPPPYPEGPFEVGAKHWL